MAHGFRRERPRRRGAAAREPVAARFVARLDAEERELLASLMIQVLSLVAPPEPEPQKRDDEFDRLLRDAGLSHLDGQAPRDAGPDSGPGAPADAGADAPADAGSATGGPAPDLPAPSATDDLDDPNRDPALDRLLPDAHREDPLVAAEFRRISARGIRARKAANLESAIGALARPGDGRHAEEVRLDEDEAQSFVVALTDVRLVVGERLQLRTDADADRLELSLRAGGLKDEAAWLVAVYDFLTWLQETLTQAMLDGLDDPRG